MTVVLSRPIAGAASRPAARAGTGAPADVQVHDSFEAVEPLWRKLAEANAPATPYQRYEWPALWHRHVDSPLGHEPLIVVGLDHHGSPLFVLPFARRRERSLVVASYFGGRHANLNAGIWRRDVAAVIEAADLKAILADVAREHGIDLFALINQPRKIGNVANPLALLPHQSAPDDVYVATFNGRTGEQALKAFVGSEMRGRLRSRRRKLEKLPGYRFGRAQTAHDADRLLDAFLEQKAAHFAAQGIDNVFGSPDIATFLYAACHHGLAEGHPVIELYGLEADGEVIAVFGAVNNGRRLSCMFNSYTVGPAGRWSPGLVLLAHMIVDCGDRRIAEFDLGAGDARYKRLFCKSHEHVFDSFLPFTVRGRIAAFRLRNALRLKRWIKSTPFLNDASKALRRSLFG